MPGPEIAASVAAVVGIVASPLFQTFFESFKNHLIKRFSKAQIMELQKNASSSNEPHPPLPIAPSELLGLEEAMGNIPLLLQLSQSINNRTGGISKFLIQLREVAYAAEDLLDELDYEDLQLKVLANKEVSTCGPKQTHYM